MKSSTRAMIVSAVAFVLSGALAYANIRTLFGMDFWWGLMSIFTNIAGCFFSVLAVVAWCGDNFTRPKQ